MAALAGLLAGAALVALLSRGPVRVPLGAARVAAPRTGPDRGDLPLRLAAGLAGAATAVLVGGAAGALAGAVVAAGALLLGPRALARLETAEAREERRLLEADLPLALDLVAACLAGGAALPAAVEAVAGALGGPLGARAGRVSAALAVGTAPEEAWGALAPTPEDPLAPVARALARASRGGAPVLAAVGRLTTDARAVRAGRREQAARRVGVLAVAPLGACFLPAFVLVGVVPVVAGLVGPLLSQL